MLGLFKPAVETSIWSPISANSQATGVTFGFCFSSRVGHGFGSTPAGWVARVRVAGRWLADPEEPATRPAVAVLRYPGWRWREKAGSSIQLFLNRNWMLCDWFQGRGGQTSMPEMPNTKTRGGPAHLRVGLDPYRRVRFCRVRVRVEQFLPGPVPVPIPIFELPERSGEVHGLLPSAQFPVNANTADQGDNLSR
ncbi:hypothetical protein B0H13DRAFT_1887957 [Mycena leptocephala]|nr:hypothetical protein B0H13DRAFT_1887957 [Mycena leptocephala]